MNLSLVNDEGIGTRPTSVERAGDGIDPLTEAKMAGAEAGVARKPFRRSIERRGGPFPSGTSWRRWVSRRHDRKVGPMIGNESGRSPRHGVGALVDIRTGIAGEGQPPSSVGTRTVSERVWRP